MTRRLLYLFVLLVLLAAIAPRAWCQFLSDEERKGMFTVSLAYSAREYEMDYRGSSVPIEEIEAVFEEFSVKEELDTIELSVAWLSFGYVELRGTIGMADYDLMNTHGTDSGFDTTFASSDNLVYGLSAAVRYPLTDSWLFAVEIGFLTGRFDGIEGEVSQLDVARGLTSSVDDIDWREVTVTPMMQFRYSDFLPYAGVRFADVTTEVNTIQTITRTGETFERVIEYENHDELSAVVGVIWRATPLIMAEFQAQFLNDERITLAVKLTF